MNYSELVNLFRDYNRRAFSGKLAGIKLEVLTPKQELVGYHCDCRFCRGKISVDLSQSNVPEILLHEMAYAASSDQNHEPGRAFQRELARLRR